MPLSSRSFERRFRTSNLAKGRIPFVKLIRADDRPTSIHGALVWCLAGNRDFEKFDEGRADGEAELADEERFYDTLADTVTQ
jgi:hypothetical protein